MFSERDRRMLAAIEEHLVHTDPDLVRMFREAPRRGGGPHRLPSVLIVIGVVFSVFGIMIATVPVALLGVTLIIVAMYVASVRVSRRPPRLA
jgi:Flp pilus assembly protein TadB